MAFRAGADSEGSEDNPLERVIAAVLADPSHYLGLIGEDWFDFGLHA